MIIQQYTSRATPPSGRETVPSGMANIAAAPAEAVAGLGGAMAKFGMDVLNQISDAQDSIGFSGVQKDAEQIRVARDTALQTTWDDKTRQQLAEKAKQDAQNLLGTIKRPNVRNMYQKYLNQVEPEWQARFNTIDRSMKIDKMKGDIKVLDDYDYEQGNRTNFTLRHERARDYGLETPTKSGFLIENFGVDSDFYTATKLIGDTNPQTMSASMARAQKILMDIEPKTYEQITKRDDLMAKAGRMADNIKDRLQDETNRDLLVKRFNNQLTREEVITALDNDFLTPEAAKYLMSSLEAAKTEFNVDNAIRVKQAIQDFRDDKIDKKELYEIYYANLSGLDEAAQKSYLNEIFETEKVDDPLNQPDIKRMFNTLGDLKTAGLFITAGHDVVPYGDMTAVEKRDSEYMWLKITNELENWIKNHPDTTPEQRDKYFKETLLKPLKESAAKGFLDRWWFKIMPPDFLPFIAYRGYQSYKLYRQLQEKSGRSAPLVEFDKVWPKITDEQKRKILAALKNGYSPKDILESLGEQ